VTFAHLCPFCGEHRPGESATVLDPACGNCGGTLHAVPAGELEAARREDAVGHVSESRSDGTTVFACLLTLPWLLPLLGASLGDVSFAIPLVLTAFAASRLWRAREAEPRWDVVHRRLAAACGLAALASAIAVVGGLAGADGLRTGLYVGALASSALLVAAGTLVVRSLRGRRPTEAVDAGLLGMVVAAAGIFFVVVPGLRSGDALLTAVVAVDLIALVLAVVGAVTLGTSRGAWWLVGALAIIAAGDGLCGAAAAGMVADASWLVALLWGAGAFGLAAVAEHGLARRPRPVAPAPAPQAGLGRSWLTGRVVAPLAAVLAYPALALAVHAWGDLPGWGVVYFGSFTLLSLLLAFGRQAHLLHDHRRAVVRERALRREATRRNEELEALTGLATTMTQTLEEAPIVEQALGVLQAAARATSAALHVADGDRRRTAAAAGDWYAERVWAPSDALGDTPQLTTRGRRAILRLPLAARGRRIGEVTLVRPESEPFDPHGIELLRLLVGQMGVAVQNARDYRDKLEQAIRDPLTGIYNRRFLHEALEKEVSRCERYGSEASLVLFDLDDFKLINDTHGHAAGDDVLRAFAAVAEQVIRPSDSLARVGGEEFALLLPETAQLEALLVADRVRTAVSRGKLLADRRVTVSGGIASFPADAVSAHDLERRADAALYWAKRNGKDLCAVAGEATAEPGEAGQEGLIAHLYALVAMIDAQQLHTRDHSENVAAYAVALAQAAGLERERTVALRRAAMLHDVGKIAVRSEILAKPGRLTDEEFEEVRRHSVIGGIMLAHAGLREEATWVRHHHERVDGRGYPDGLGGDELPLEARILFVADAFEAMTSDRPYRSGITVEEALDELRRCAGTQFDPHLVELLDQLVADGRLAVLALREG
jgi:diguanylate cyclase (GGDEF)-like protein